MAAIARRINEWLADDSGQGTTEYAFVLALVALVVASVLRALGTTAFGFFQDLIARIS